MSEQKATNITWHMSTVTREDREKLLGQRGCVIWFTGLPASGKSTLANELATALHKKGQLTYVLDGDNVRHGLNKNLGFSPDDRRENIRRVSEVAKLFADSSLLVITAFISPYRIDRDKARSLLEAGRFIEVFVDCPVEVCEDRDPKGLYKKARSGEIGSFTGISAPYEVPEIPEVTVETANESIEASVEKVVNFLSKKGLIGR